MGAVKHSESLTGTAYVPFQVPWGVGTLGQGRPDAPSEPGCVLAGDMQSPVDIPSPVSEVTASVPSTEATSFSLETPALSPGPGHLWSTPTAGQAWTLGLPPRRGASSLGSHSGNSTRHGMKASVAPGPGTGQWTASRVAFSPRVPEPTHSSSPGATDSLPDTPGQSPPNSTAEQPFWPTPAPDPTGHIEWHSSLPMRDTPPAPLDPTRVQNLDPGPFSSPDQPLAPTPASLKTPACGECQGECILGLCGAMWCVSAHKQRLIQSRAISSPGWTLILCCVDPLQHTQSPGGQLRV